MMFGIMGHLVSVLSSKPLVSFLRDKFWKPWGMNSTFLGIDDLKDQGRDDELAQEYMYANASDPFVRLPHYRFTAGTGAGAEIVHYHGGAVNAFFAHMLMIPGKNFGLVTMLNSNSNAQEMVVWEVLYEYFKVPEGERFDVEQR